MTAATQIPRRCSPTRPTPDAVRCPTRGCFRRRNPAPRGGGLTATCHHCRAVAGVAWTPVKLGRPKLPPKPFVPRPPAPVAVAAGKALVLTRDVPAEVYSVEACRESSTVPPEFRTLPAGTACVAVGRLSKSDGGGDPVVELVECGGRFVCPLHSMRVAGVQQ